MGGRAGERAGAALILKQFVRSILRALGWVKFIKWNRAAIVLDNSHMISAQGAWIVDTAGMGNQAGAIADFADIAFNPLRLVSWIKTLLQFFAVGGDAGRAGVFVAFK